MLGLLVLSWVLAPAVMLLTAWGCGLLVWRAGGGVLPGSYVLPLGFALVVVAGAFLTAYGSIARLAGFALVALAVAGFALERHRIRSSLRLGGGFIWPAL